MSAAYAAQEAEQKLMDDLRKKGISAEIQTRIVVAHNSGDTTGEAAAKKEQLQQERKERLDALDQEKKDALKKVTETGVDRLAAELLITTNIRKQIDAVNAEFDIKEEENNRQKDIARVEKALAYAQQALNIYSKFADAKNSRENAALKKELQANDARKEGIRKLEAGKVISTQEARRQIRDIEIQDDAKRQALEKKQFERRKRMQIAEALINGAQAVVRTIAIYGPPIPTSPKGIELFCL